MNQNNKRIDLSQKKNFINLNLHKKIGILSIPVPYHFASRSYRHSTQIIILTFFLISYFKSSFNTPLIQIQSYIHALLFLVSNKGIYLNLKSFICFNLEFKFEVI